MPDLGAAPGVYPARPSFNLGGQDQPALSDGLQELLIEETSAGLSRCEATFANWGPKGGAASFLYFDRQLIDFGKALTVSLGAGQAQGQVFEGRVMGIEGRFLRSRPPEILVLAEDRLQDLRMTRRTRTFENVSDADLFQQVASQYGLQAKIDVTGPTYRVMAQVNQSDLAFLRERARAVDAELWVSGKTLNATSRNRRKAGDLTLTYGQGLHEFSVLADLAGQVSSFTVTGWDVSGKQGLSHRATDSALSGELNGDSGGSAVLAQAIGQRDQQIVHDLPINSQEAQALAEGDYRRAARRFVTGRGVAEGDARLRVGTKLQLNGVGTLFDGTFYVTRVQHVFDGNSGYRTYFSVERPGIGH
jgi:phage protein D